MADLQTLRCQASITASVSPIQVHLGRLSLPPLETTLHSLLTKSYTQIAEIYNLYDPDSILSGDPSTLSRILDAILDTTSRPFVDPNSEQILAGLDDHDKACLYLQAVAGMVMIFERLKSAAAAGGAEPELSAGVLARRLRSFSESRERREVLDRIAGSDCFSKSYARADVVEFLVGVIREQQDNDDFATQQQQHQQGRTELAGVSGDSWGSGERPCKNMGLPWGFTIMAIN